MKRRTRNLDIYYSCDFYNAQRRGCDIGRCGGFGFLYGKASIHNSKKGNSQSRCACYISRIEAAKIQANLAKTSRETTKLLEDIIILREMAKIKQ